MGSSLAIINNSYQSIILAIIKNSYHYRFIAIINNSYYYRRIAIIIAITMAPGRPGRTWKKSAGGGLWPPDGRMRAVSCQGEQRGSRGRGFDHRSAGGLERVKNSEQNAIKPVATYDPQSLGPP